MNTKSQQSKTEAADITQPSAACQLYLNNHLEGIKDVIRESSSQISERLQAVEILIQADHDEIMAVKADLLGNGKKGFRQVRDEFTAHQTYHQKIEERTWQVIAGVVGKLALVTINIFLAYALFFSGGNKVNRVASPNHIEYINE